MNDPIPHPPPLNRARRGSIGALSALTAVAVCGLVPRAAHAQSALINTTLTGTTYSVSITNHTAVELGEVDFTFPTDPVLTALSAPTGFIINYDQPSGSLVFAEDTGSFSPGSTIGTFFFSSSKTITPSVIEGLNDNGDSLAANGGIAFPSASGQSRTTFIGGAAPEPGSLGLLALGAGPGLALLGRVQLRRRRAAVNLTKG